MIDIILDTQTQPIMKTPITLQHEGRNRQDGLRPDRRCPVVDRMATLRIIGESVACRA
jgi:hypothetical protein